MTDLAASQSNPGYLKLELCAKGIRLDAEARQHAESVRGPFNGDETARGVELVLPEDVWVSAPLDESGRVGTPFELSIIGDGIVLQRDGSRMEARLVAQPEFYGKLTTRGTPMWHVARIFGSCIAVNPSAACGYTVRGRACAFCQDGTESAPDVVLAATPQEVTEAVGAAFDEGVGEFVYFNTGHFAGEDGGIGFLEPYIRAIKRHFDTLVAVQVHPPTTNAWIDRTYAMGVDALSYAVEVYDPEVLSRVCPGRARHFGPARYAEALQHAAIIFPHGTVWSELIVGMEPPESTIRGIDALTSMGVVPVLSVVRPAAGDLGAAGGSLETLLPIYAHLFHAVRAARINMGWVRDLSFAITPLEARFFAGDEARMAVAMQQFYRSRIGNMTARNLARLRRRLRVRRVSDSFDSSHL